MTREPFKDHLALYDYAEAHGLEYAWEGTKAFDRRKGSLPPDEFEVRPVRTRKGIINVLLFAKRIRAAEAHAHQKRMSPERRAWYRELTVRRGPAS